MNPNPSHKNTIVTIIVLVVLVLVAIFLSMARKTPQESGIDAARQAELKQELQAPPPNVVKTEAQIKAELNQKPASDPKNMSLEEQERIRNELRD